MTKTERTMLWLLIVLAMFNGAIAGLRLAHGPDPRLEVLLDEHCGPRETFDGHCRAVTP